MPWRSDALQRVVIIGSIKTTRRRNARKTQVVYSWKKNNSLFYDWQKNRTERLLHSLLFFVSIFESWSYSTRIDLFPDISSTQIRKSSNLFWWSRIRNGSIKSSIGSAFFLIGSSSTIQPFLLLTGTLVRVVSTSDQMDCMSCYASRCQRVGENIQSAPLNDLVLTRDCLALSLWIWT